MGEGAGREEGRHALASLDRVDAFEAHREWDGIPSLLEPEQGIRAKQGFDGPTEPRPELDLSCDGALRCPLGARVGRPCYNPGMNEVILCPEGLRARSENLWLDARRKTPLSFVSHAHGDHIGRHEVAIGTASTLELMRHRLRGAKTRPRPLAYGEAIQVGDLRVELFPAGHILGSAQIRITRKGHRTVYTGDLNTSTSRTAEPLEVVPCDTLVIESTFGEPRYRFPPRAEVEEKMAAFAEITLLEGRVPVFLAYALGKAQEATKILCERGYRVRVHPDAWALCEIYQAHGVDFPGAAPLDAPPAPGEVVVSTPRGRGDPLLGPRVRIRTCFLSGWAVQGGAPYRMRVDAALPLSDHADFDGLISYAEATGAAEVLTTHGSAEQLARHLRTRGIAARALSPSPQLELF